MTLQEKAEFDAQIEQRLLGIMRRTEAIIRDLNEGYYEAESAKQRIKAEYQLRRLRRFTGERA
jgi:hypothetical protein